MERLTWRRGELAEAKEIERGYSTDHPDPERLYREHMCLTPPGVQRVLAGEPLRDGDLAPDGHVELDVVFKLPRKIRLAWWNSVPAARTWGNMDEIVPGMLAIHGLAALPGVVRQLADKPTTVVAAIGMVDSPAVVPGVLHAFRHQKHGRDPALAWMRDHLGTLVAVALPLAAGAEAGRGRDDARHALRWLCANGHEDAIRRQAAEGGKSLQGALALVLDDAAQPLPAQAKLPAFFEAAKLPRPMLRTGAAMPLAAVTRLGTLLAMSTPDAPHAGLRAVQADCTPESLADFAWGVFEAWQAARLPKPQEWAFLMLVPLGGDAVAARLAERVRTWPPPLRSRAREGLRQLATLGSEAALAQLQDIAQRASSKALRQSAGELLDAAAAARGLSREELADELLPDFGLDASGTTTLDFGPRQFTVGFDEHLRPFVRDASGARLKDLPAPAKRDDAALAAAARERFTHLKAGVRGIAGRQARRLEGAMRTGRRWTAAEFRTLFLAHPLMRHLARGLLWGVYRRDGLARCFRIAEDGSLADEQDREWKLPANATVGIVHVLELTPPQLQAWRAVWVDYELQPPFPQLERETFRLRGGEAKGTELGRLVGGELPTGGVLGLEQRGWVAGEPESGRISSWFLAVDETRDVVLLHSPGIPLGDARSAPTQRIERVFVQRVDGQGNLADFERFGTLPPVFVSEVLRDLAPRRPAA